MERAVLLATGRWITPLELSNMTRSRKFPDVLCPDDTFSLKTASRRLERNLIEKALKFTGGNRTQTARILEISRPMLLSKIKAYNLDL
jgi:two-component system response regulator AtoC